MPPEARGRPAARGVGQVYKSSPCMRRDEKVDVFIPFSRKKGMSGIARANMPDQEKKEAERGGCFPARDARHRVINFPPVSGPEATLSKLLGAVRNRGCVP